MVKGQSPPCWAVKRAGANDRAEAVNAYRKGLLWANWDSGPITAGRNYAGNPVAKGPPRAWAKERGWPTPWWSFKKAFLATMLKDDGNFLLALTEGGVELYYPKSEHTLSPDELRRLDEMYSERSADGRPSRWDRLVEELREIRRAIEAGVTIKVEGEALASWNCFYNWAHGRYHLLEDGYDKWIGDDRS